MQRRAFLRSGALAAGFLGVGGTGAAIAPEAVGAPRRPRPGSPIRLSSNENPLGIAPEARRAIIEGLGDANRYPQQRAAITEALAERHAVGAEHIVLGAGSTEVLKMAVDALALPSGRLVLAEPTFEDAWWYAGAGAPQIEAVPLRADQAHDLERMRELAERSGAPALVYICNPNNPTGTLTPSAEVDEWIASAPEQVYFLIDEAYYDYVRDPRYWTALKWVPDRPTVIVVRTFSKIYGMAGIRLGYAVAHEETAARLRRLHVRNNANHFALVAGLASLDARDFVRQSLEVNERGKQLLYAALEALGLEYFPSHTNFVMHRINGDLEAYIARMGERGILVGRPFPPLTGHNRVSIGLPHEMKQFVTALRSFRRAGWI